MSLTVLKLAHKKLTLLKLGQCSELIKRGISKQPKVIPRVTSACLPWLF